MDSENLFLWLLYLICFQQINTEFKLIDWIASCLAVTQSASSRLLCKLFGIVLLAREEHERQAYQGDQRGQPIQF
jgi:hypothetical protein